MRDDVLTALKPFGIKVLAFDCWGAGHHYYPAPSWLHLPDSDIWVKRHIARITVSDAQAAWAERLLWQSHRVELDTPKLNRNLVWSAPAACTAGEHGTLGRGTMPTPWRDGKGRRQRRQRRRPQHQDDGLFAALAGWWK